MKASMSEFENTQIVLERYTISLPDLLLRLFMLLLF